MRTGSSAPTDRRLVLLVDDYDDGRQMFATLLADAGFDVAEARDGYEAIDRARRLHPDVILMDLSLPGLDGSEASRRLKADSRTRQIPIVAVSAHPFVEEGSSACDSFVAKPCTPDQLVRAIARVLPSAALARPDVN